VQDEVVTAPRDIGQRIRPLAITAGPFQRDVGLHDALLDGRCRYDVDVDGIPRCAPEPSYTVETYYADPQCTVLIDVMRYQYSAHSVPNPFAATRGSEPPWLRAPYYRRGALVTEPVYLRFPDSPCFAYTNPPAFYRVAGVVQLADLAVLTEAYQ